MSDTAAIVAKLNAACQELTGPGAPFEIERRQILGVELHSYKNAPANLVEALDEGRKHGQNTFITFGEERYSFDEFFSAADKLSHHLHHNYQIRKGDRIAIAMRNYPEWMIAFVAIVSAGAVVVPLNSWGQADELEYALDDAGVDILFCDQQRAELIGPRLAALSCKAIVAKAEDMPLSEHMAYWSSTQQGPDQRPELDISSADHALIMYTSGTSGKPKGAVSTHFAICQTLSNFETHAYMSAMANPEAIGKIMNSGFAPSTLLAVPLFHVSGCYSVFLLNLRGGRKTSIMYKWSPEDALKIIERESITIFTGVPTMTLALLESDDFATTDTSSLATLGAGGTACPPHLKDLIYEKVPGAYPGTGYGMTETNATCCSCTGEAFRLRPGSSGTLSPVVEFKTVDDNGADMTPGETGEIYIKSPTNALQYWNLPLATASTFIDGWVATGDVGYIDAEGFVYIVDRIKDMVIRGGENIYPLEIEGILVSHPAVLEAAVYGLPDDHWGEELVATVTLHPDSGADIATLQAHIGAHLAKFKIPTTMVIAEGPLAKNPTGKLLKKVIREQHLAAREAG